MLTEFQKRPTHWVPFLLKDKSFIVQSTRGLFMWRKHFNVTINVSLRQLLVSFNSHNDIYFEHFFFTTRFILNSLKNPQIHFTKPSQLEVENSPPAPSLCHLAVVPRQDGLAPPTWDVPMSLSCSILLTLYISHQARVSCIYFEMSQFIWTLQMGRDQKWPCNYIPHFRVS